MAVGQKADCWLSPGPNNTINFHHNYANDEDTHLLICSSSNKHNYNKLIQTALDYYNKTILKKQVKKEEGELLQNDSVMLDKLGYCTWNAFGKSVNTEKLTEALDSLQKNDIPIAYAILDDGWQSSICEQLISLEADKEKFPGGLQNTISKLKARYPFVQYVGVWHVSGCSRKVICLHFIHMFI
jgi:alpha-galactosidase